MEGAGVEAATVVPDNKDPSRLELPTKSGCGSNQDSSKRSQGSVMAQKEVGLASSYGFMAHNLFIAEIEGFFNLLFSHIILLFPPAGTPPPSQYSSVIGAIVASRAQDHIAIQLRVWVP